MLSQEVGELEGLLDLFEEDFDLTQHRKMPPASGFDPLELRVIRGWVAFFTRYLVAG